VMRDLGEIREIGLDHRSLSDQRIPTTHPIITPHITPSGVTPQKVGRRTRSVGLRRMLPRCLEGLAIERARDAELVKDDHRTDRQLG
jgi:hypothetical protein